MSAKLDELKAMNTEYAEIVGEKVYTGAWSPDEKYGEAQWRFNFQGHPSQVIGIDSALENMRGRMAEAKAGKVWTGQTIAEFQAEKKAMEAAHRG